MYYFEKARFGVPLFYKENGIPIFFDDERISSRHIVLWMPINWIAMAIILAIIPVAWLLSHITPTQEPKP